MPPTPTDVETRCVDALRSHPALRKRHRKSRTQLDRVRDALTECAFIRNQPLAVFCAGSLARMEAGAKSDLDLFLTADSDRGSDLHKRLFQIKLFSELTAINEQLDFPTFSNDGVYRTRFLGHKFGLRGLS